MIVPDDFPAFSAFVHIVHAVCVACSYLEFQIPVDIDRQSIAIADAGSCKPSLKSVVLQDGEVGSGEFEISVQISYIEYTSMKMETEEMSGKAVT